ncbi:MAG TPA: lecithin retinol acyltransferase family protein [Paraburkholderia sp.]|uniref:lecithin retinol acyltransferase family protein n=1 Tax=Paraburkholderia sp. TaxID=1926495 RepID=UPI002C7038E4|nr:lecithin retinol acyltransferase family protein [Paraburkholderia sp.]HTR08218.1 lecithin retinol acyltransferase family protein [Paraburkholderia sp.]
MSLDLHPMNSCAEVLPRAAARSIARTETAGEEDLPLGAHLVSRRAGYSHHGIYVGAGRVVHYAGLCTSLHRGPIEEVTLERFAAGHEVEVVAHPFAAYAGREAVERARSRLGEDRYRLLSNNCEHFCTWCVDGKGRSEQVRTCVAHPLAALRVVRALVHARRAQRCRGAFALQAA